MKIEDSASLERLEGTVERTVFHNEENGFTVLRVKVDGRKDLVTLVGAAPAVAPGEDIEAEGQWTVDLIHGPQFKASHITASAPSGRGAVLRFLASGLIAGVGPALAERIVKKFGARALDVIEETPMQLLKVAGIGKQTAARIAESYRARKKAKEIVLAFEDKGIKSVDAMRLFRHFGDKALEIVEREPYRLALEVRGIGFTSADAIAQKFGIAQTAPARLRAGLGHVLELAAEQGHTLLPRAHLCARASTLLGVSLDAVEDALSLALRYDAVKEVMVEGASFIASHRYAQLEQAIAVRLRAMAAGAPSWGRIDVINGIGRFEAARGKTLSSSQRAALALVVAAKAAIITGGPGVGKTTLLEALLALLAGEKLSIALAAPTGRAARRMSEQTGREAKTIHRLLEIDPLTGIFRHDRHAPLDADLVIIDEVSMVDVPLMAALLEAIPERAALILIGDSDQLPSVGPGQVLADLIAAKVLPIAHLTEIFRQAEESAIIVNAHRINQGQKPLLAETQEVTDFYLIPAQGAEDGLAKLIKVVGTRIPERFGLDPLRDVQVITPMQKGLLGARNLNERLARLLNLHAAHAIERFGTAYAVGDKVMQVENDYQRDVFNGDLGLVQRLDDRNETLTAVFDGREVNYHFQDLEALQRAYAITIHKSQGSEYPAVVIPLMLEHSIMLARNLLYTAVTRGKALVVLIAEPAALEAAVSNRHRRPRFTQLQMLLGDQPSR